MAFRSTEEDGADVSGECVVQHPLPTKTSLCTKKLYSDTQGEGRIPSRNQKGMKPKTEHPSGKIFINPLGGMGLCLSHKGLYSFHPREGMKHCHPLKSETKCDIPLLYNRRAPKN